MEVTELGMVMPGRLLHPAKQLSGMVVMVSGKVTLVRLLQSRNILCSREGVVTLLRLVQPLNKPGPIEVTDSGIIIFVRLVHPLNTPDSMVVTDSGIVIFFKLQPENA